MKSMNRRAFIAGAAAAAAMPAFAPLVPVSKADLLAVYPPVHVPNTLAASGNVFLSADLVAKESLRILRVELRRAYALSPDEMDAEIKQLSPADRAYVIGADA